MKKIVIIHYNTTLLTNALIKSINKNVKDAIIYIFDNSDTNPFINTYDNVRIIDNTKGSIINFDEWLEKYPTRLKTKELTAKYGSAKHSITIQKCIDLFDDNFVLMDSDILLKEDISFMFNDNYIYVGEHITQKNGIERVLPYLCFFNVEKIKKNGIRYFNHMYMHGLHYTENGDKYDTGANFYMETKYQNFSQIDLSKYIVHYGSGSWVDKRIKDQRTEYSQNEWLEKYRNLWDDVPSIKTGNKRVIYTCITGGYDTLKKPLAIDRNFDYVCFTDNPTLETYGIWELRPIPKDLNHLSTVKMQRNIKILPHKYLSEYEISVWIDGNITIKNHIDIYVDNVLEDGISIYIPKHPLRNCIYAEAIACKNYKKDFVSIINEQMKLYRSEGFPKNYGLPQSNIVIRKHNDDKCVRFMNEWASELNRHSHRDQLSFSYVLWKNSDISIKYLERNLDVSYYFSKEKHPGKIVYEKNNTKIVRPQIKTMPIIRSNKVPIIRRKR